MGCRFALFALRDAASTAGRPASSTQAPFGTATKVARYLTRLVTETAEYARHLAARSHRAAGRPDRGSTVLRGTGAAADMVECVYRGRRCDIPPRSPSSRVPKLRVRPESAREAPDRPPMTRRNRMLRNAPPGAINLPRAPLAATPPYRALTARPILCHVQESDPGAAPALPDPFLLAADTDLA
jgi:hypothetical protein